MSDLLHEQFMTITLTDQLVRSLSPIDQSTLERNRFSYQPNTQTTTFVLSAEVRNIIQTIHNQPRN